MHDILAPFKGDNRHPVDRLGEVRQLIKEAKEVEAALKEEVGALMGSGDSVGGDEYIASQRLSERRGSYDEKRLKAYIGDAVESFRKPPTVVVTIATNLRSEVAA